MIRETLILGIEHESLLNEFLLFSSGNLGSTKMDEIIKKVNTSGVVSKFLYEAERINERLGTDDFLGCIHSSRSFFFSKAETISVASIVLLKKWNYLIGEPKNLSNDIYLNKIFFSILVKCDGLKTHIKTGSNFFEKFSNHINKFYLSNTFNNHTPEIKKDIFFDSVFCKAIKERKKTEFRVIDNLLEINLLPDTWKFVSYDKYNGAILSTFYLDEPLLVYFPYKLGDIINVYNSENPNKIDSKIKIISCYLQRLKDVNNSDVEKEGFGVYEEQIENMFQRDPSLDAAYILFLEDWMDKHGGTLFRNEWLWAFQFEIQETFSQLPSQPVSDEFLKKLMEM